MIEDLKQRFWTPLAAQHKAGAWDELNARYSEIERAYHSWIHIADLLRKLEDLSDLAVCPSIIATAIFWHDSVYLTRSANGHPRTDRENVKDSAELFRTYTLLDRPSRYAVYNMIMATSDHRRAKAESPHYPGFSDDLDLFLDLDLSSLGGSWKEFKDNFTRIRSEFFWLPESDFLFLQIQNLEKFARDDTELYRRIETRAKWASFAKSNLTRCISDLKKRAWAKSTSDRRR
jgi:predicted metal-dependent HD superfamily phosphohydrolase